MSKHIESIGYKGDALGGNVGQVTALISNMNFAADDYITIMVSSRNNSDSITEQTSEGWVSISENSSAARGTSRVFAKITDGTENNPIFEISGVDTDMVWGATLWRGLEHTTEAGTVIATSDSANSFDNDVTFPTVDTTGNSNAVIMYIIRTELRDRKWFTSNNIKQELNIDNGSSGSSECLSMGWYVQQSGGTTEAAINAIMSGVGDDYTLHVIALKNDGNNDIAGQQDPASFPATLVHPLFFTSGVFYGGDLQDGAESSNDPSTIISNLDDPSTGVATIKQATASISSTGFTDTNKSNPNYAGFSATSSTHYDDANINGTKLASTHDFSSSVFSILLYANNKNVYSWGDDGAYWIGLMNGDLTNGAAATFRLAAEDTVVRPTNGIFPYIFDSSSSGNYQTHTGGTGTLDLTSVNRLAIACIPTSSNQAAFGWLYQLNNFVLVGGSTTTKASLADIADHTSKVGLRTVQNQSGQSTSQYNCAQSIQIGNGGTNTTIAKFTGQACGFLSAFDATTKFVHGNVEPGAFSFIIYPGASDNFDFSGYTITCGDNHKVTWHASYNTSSTVDYNGLLIIDGDVTMIETGSAITGITFITCLELDINGANLSGGCTISSCTDAQAVTLTAATQAALQLLVNDIANCTWLSNAVAVRIEFTGATADISLNFDGITWTTNTTDIHYQSTNASTLTANMQNGANASTSAISGAAVAVVISNDVTFTVDINVAGAELTLLERGTQTEVDHVETATTSESYVYTYASDVNLDINVYKPGYKSVWIDTAALTSSDQTITVVLDPEPATQI